MQYLLRKIKFILKQLTNNEILCKITGVKGKHFTGELSG